MGTQREIRQVAEVRLVDAIWPCARGIYSHVYRQGKNSTYSINARGW